MATVETVQPASPFMPPRSVVQRREALQRANEIRFYRARVKRALRTGELNIVELLGGPVYEDGLLQGMTMFELLYATPRFGQTKTRACFTRAMISPSKKIGGLTFRQRDALLREVEGRIRYSAERKAAEAR